jgi:hypothetical protein
MKFGRRIIAAGAIAAAGLGVPAVMAATSAPAQAQGLCVHLYLQIGSPPPAINLAVIVLPPLSIVQGACPA